MREYEQVIEFEFRQEYIGLHQEAGYPTAEKLAEILEICRRVIFDDRSFMNYRFGGLIDFGRGDWCYTDKTTWSLPCRRSPSRASVWSVI